MLIITAQVNAPPGQAMGVKEDLAMYAERFGNTRIISVVEKLPADMEQLSMDKTIKSS